MSGGAVFGNWLFGSTVIVVLFMVFYICFKKEGYVCISVYSHHTLGSPRLRIAVYEAKHVRCPSFIMI